MTKVSYNSITGNILGYYPDDLNYTTIPKPYIEIDDITYQDCITNQGLRKVDLTTLKIVSFVPEHIYVIRNGMYLYDYYQDGDTLVTERPTPPNTYTSYEWGTIHAIAGKRSYEVTTNFIAGDTLSLCGVTLTLGTDIIGTDSETTTTNLKTILSTNTIINALYTVTVSGATLTLTEIVAGGGNTPSESTTTGTGIITNSTAITSTPQTTGWKIDLATSLDALNSSYATAKAEIHKQHSGVILANWLTTEQITTAEANLKTVYKNLHDDLITKQEALKNG